MISFSDAKSIIESGCLELLGRSLEQQLQFKVFSEQLKLEWSSSSDYILSTKFGIPIVLNPDETKSVVKPFPPEFQTEKLVLSENQFPYYFEPTVQHFLLWKLNGLITENEIFNAIESLKSSVVVADFAYYVNPPHLKSMPEIEHAHIIVFCPSTEV